MNYYWLYATTSLTYRYDNLVATVTDPGSDTYTYTYDFLGRFIQAIYPDSSSVSYSYDDANYKMTVTKERGYDRIYWYDWLSRLTKVEEEYATDTFAVTTYEYDGNSTQTFMFLRITEKPYVRNTTMEISLMHCSQGVRRVDHLQKSSAPLQVCLTPRFSPSTHHTESLHQHVSCRSTT
jgi:YD repeat-containing protein